MWLLNFLFIMLCASAGYARTNPYILGASQAAPEVLMVSGSLSALTGTDNLDVDIPVTGQIIAFFLKKDAPASGLMFRTSVMGGNTAVLTVNNAWISNCIQSLGIGTVQLGSNPECNAAGATFYYVALTDLGGNAEVGLYSGNAPTDNHDVALTASWTPGLVLVSSSAANSKFWASTSSLATGNQACNWRAGNCAEDLIQAFAAGQFQVGSNVATNGSGTNNLTYLAINTAVPGLDNAVQNGNGLDNQTVTLDAAFTPLIVARKEDSAVEGWYRFGAQAGDASFLGTNASAANCIQSLSAGSYGLGNGTDCNDNAISYLWWALGL